MPTKLFVGCLPFSKTEADLLPVFTQFGNVEEVAVLKNKGAAFVTFTDADEAAQVINDLQGYCFEGSARGINVSYATSGGGGGGGGGKGVKTELGLGLGHKPTRFSHQPPPPPGSPGGAGVSGWSSLLPGISPSAGQGVPGSKLFVGQLPYSKTEADLMQLFSSIGPVEEVVLLKHRQTQEKKGAAFVRYQTVQHAAAAVGALDGFVFNGATRPITVSIATGGADLSSMGTPAHQAKRSFAAASPKGAFQAEDGAKLFVGQLPYSKSERDLQELFSKFGQIAEVMLHKDANGQKKGAAFVSFFQANSAALALELDGYLFPGSSRAITVNFAGVGGGKRQRVA